MKQTLLGLVVVLQSSVCSIIVFMLFTGITLGQEKSKDQIKVLTVCEVLSGASDHTDAVVAVVGRMQRSVSLIDHYEFISQDGCESPVVTHGHVWSNKIQILTDWGEGMPKPPSDKPMLKRSALAAKLSTLRKTTKLGFHQEPQFKADRGSRTIRYSHTASVPNRWAVVYGRIVPVPDLNEDCGADGCGGFDVPLIVIAESYNVHRLDVDGTPLPAEH